MAVPRGTSPKVMGATQAGFTGACRRTGARSAGLMNIHRSWKVTWQEVGWLSWLLMKYCISFTLNWAFINSIHLVDHEGESKEAVTHWLIFRKIQWHFIKMHIYLRITASRKPRAESTIIWGCGPQPGICIKAPEDVSISIYCRLSGKWESYEGWTFHFRVENRTKTKRNFHHKGAFKWASCVHLSLCIGLQQQTNCSWQMRPPATLHNWFELHYKTSCNPEPLWMEMYLVKNQFSLHSHPARCLRSA